MDECPGQIEYESERLQRLAETLLPRHWLLERRDAERTTATTSAYTLVDRDHDLGQLLLRYPWSWTVWIDAPHAPREVRLTATRQGGQYTIRRG
jgi:hypothetical protein